MSIGDWIKEKELDKPMWERHGKPLVCVHRVGLQAPDGCRCVIDHRGDAYVFSCGTSEWTLPKGRITNIERMRESEVQTYIANSPALAMLGGLSFGVIGAVVGAAMGVRKRRVICDRFLVFEYVTEDGEPSSVIVQYADELIGSAKQSPRSYVADFKRHCDKYGKGVVDTL